MTTPPASAAAPTAVITPPLGRQRGADHGGRRVLLATDDSVSGRTGEEWVRRLRWAVPPLVDVVTVAGEPAWYSRLSAQTYRAAVREAMLESRQGHVLAAQRIANAVGERLQRDGFDVHVWARQGRAAAEIVTMTRLETVDLVVVSPCGRSPHTRAWQRCTASEVAEQVDVPVLLARGAPPAGPLPRHVLVVFGADRGRETVTWLRAAGWLADARLSLARVGDVGDDDPSRLPGKLAADPSLADTGGSDGVVRDIRSADDAVLLAHELGADVVVVPRHGVPFATAVAEAAGHDPGVSVLLVPSAAGVRPAARADHVGARHGGGAREPLWRRLGG